MTSEDSSLKGKTVLVTGAGQGLGRATSLAFACRGAKIALVDINEASLSATLKELRDNGSECVSIVADIASSGAPHHIVQQVVTQLGTLDVLVNNAAVSSVESLLDVTEKEWDKELLSELSTAMRDASICGLGQAAPNPLLSVIKYFPEEVGLASGRGAPPPKPAEGIVT